MTSSVLKKPSWGLWLWCTYKSKHIQALDWIMTNQTELKAHNNHIINHSHKPQLERNCEHFKHNNQTLAKSPLACAVTDWSCCGQREVSLRWCFPAFQHWTAWPFTFELSSSQLHLQKICRTYEKNLYLFMAMNFSKLSSAFICFLKVECLASKEHRDTDLSSNLCILCFMIYSHALSVHQALSLRSAVRRLQTQVSADCSKCPWCDIKPYTVCLQILIL